MARLGVWGRLLSLARARGPNIPILVLPIEQSELHVVDVEGVRRECVELLGKVEGGKGG